MAARKFIDLTVEAREEELDLNLSLGRDKGKRPLEGSQENRKKKMKIEEAEEISTGHTSEDKIACLEQEVKKLKKMIEDQEKLAKRNNAALTSRIDRFFYWSTQCFCNQQQRSVDCMNGIYTTLRDIAQSLAPRNGRGVMIQYGPPNPRPPRL